MWSYTAALCVGLVAPHRSAGVSSLVPAVTPTWGTSGVHADRVSANFMVGLQNSGTLKLVKKFSSSVHADSLTVGSPDYVASDVDIMDHVGSRFSEFSSLKVGDFEPSVFPDCNRFATFGIFRLSELTAGRRVWHRQLSLDRHVSA